MRYLIIDNASMFEENGHHFTNALNGSFLDELLECGNQLTCFQFVSYSANNISSFDLEQHGIRCVPVNGCRNKLVRYVLAYLKLIKEISRSDFVYFYYPNSYRYGTWICRFMRKKFGLYIRGMVGVQDKVSLAIYRNADVIFTVSDLFTNMVNNIRGEQVAHTIRPMIPYSDDDVIKDRIYNSKESYELLYLGRLDKDKGLTELMQASMELKTKGRKFTVKIVGNGEFKSSLDGMIEQYGLQDIVSLEGPVFDNERKKQYYLQADMYVLPTYHEGFPRTLYEAMIFGTPIITTYVGGIPALMKDGVNSRKIEPHSSDSIVQVLEWAMDHYNEMGKMATTGSKLVAGIVDKNRMSHAGHLNSIIQGYGE